MEKNTDIRTAFEQVMAADHEIPAKQKQVLAASLALFAEQGFANTTTKQIADARGWPRGRCTGATRPRTSCWRRC